MVHIQYPSDEILNDTKPARSLAEIQSTKPSNTFMVSFPILRIILT